VLLNLPSRTTGATELTFKDYLVLQNYLPSRTTGATELSFKDYWCYRTCLEELAVQQNYLLSRTTGATELKRNTTPAAVSPCY